MQQIEYELQNFGQRRVDAPGKLASYHIDKTLIHTDSPKLTSLSQQN